MNTVSLEFVMVMRGDIIFIASKVFIIIIIIIIIIITIIVIAVITNIFIRFFTPTSNISIINSIVSFIQTQIERDQEDCKVLMKTEFLFFILLYLHSNHSLLSFFLFYLLL